MFGRKRADDDLKSKGLIKWINKLFRFVLFPFIHPWVFLMLLLIFVALAAGLPIYNGISFNDAPSWWKQKIGYYYQQTEGVINDSVVNPFKDKIGGLQKSTNMTLNIKSLEKMPGKAEMVEYETPQMVNRRAFAKAQEVPVDVKATIENTKALSPKIETYVKTNEVARKPMSNKATVDTVTETPVLFNRIDGLGLVYETVPYKISGTAQIINANEISINGTVLFLYGIYSVPASEEGRRAEAYLQDNIADKDVDCWVGAKTTDGLATAICFYNDININQRLIDLGYSKNVGFN